MSKSPDEELSERLRQINEVQAKDLATNVRNFFLDNGLDAAFKLQGLCDSEDDSIKLQALKTFLATLVKVSGLEQSKLDLGGQVTFTPVNIFGGPDAT